MLPYFAGGNPFATSPMQAIAAQAQEAQAPQPQADPQTTGSVPQAAPPADSGGPGILGTIGNKLSDAFSGRGLLGPQPGDDVVDPSTGVTRGEQRAAGMSSMMKMGMLLFAAGQHQSEDSKAALLSKAPALLGDSSDLNSFAKSRLEMAKLRLEQRKQAAEEQSLKDSSAAIAQLSGGGGTAQAAPTAGAGAVQQAQAGLQTAGEATGLSTAAPGATPAPASIAAPGGVPRSGMPLLSREQALALSTIPGAAGRAQALSQAVTGAEGRERQGAPTFNPVTNKIETPIYDGRGALVRTVVGDTPAPTIREIDGKRVKGYALPNGGFHPTDIQDVAEDPSAVEDRKNFTGVLTKRAEAFNEEYGEQQKGLNTYDKLKGVRDKILSGQGQFGTGASFRVGVLRALGTAGALPQKYVNDLIANGEFQNATKSSIASVIKDFNGSQNVSDRDVKLAQDVAGSSFDGLPEEAVNALTRNMGSVRSGIANYNERLAAHNELAKKIPGELSRSVAQGKLVDRDFSKDDAEYAQKYQEFRDRRDKGGTAAPAPTSEGGVVQFVRDPKTGKLVRAK